MPQRQTARPDGLGYRLMRAEHETVLYVYDFIGADLFGDGVTATQIVADLGALGATQNISVRINSPGGDVFEGVAIYNALARFGGQVNVHIDGIAASAASLIAMAGDRIEIAENAMMMVHRAWTVAMGDASEMRAAADMLDRVWSAMLATYSRRTGMTADEIEARVVAESGELWMTAQEAVDAGFADAVGAPGDAQAYGIRQFAHVPERVAASARDEDAPLPRSLGQRVGLRAGERLAEWDVTPQLAPPRVSQPEEPDEPETPVPSEENQVAAARRRREVEILDLMTR